MILTGLQTLPTFKLYRDNPLRMTVNVGADFDLDGIDDLEIVFDMSARYGAQPRVSWLATLAGDVLSRDGQTIRLVADTIAVSEDDAEAALADVIETGGGSYALSIRGTMGDAPVGLALVGDLEWVGPGALTERRGAINNAVINLNVIDNEITVSVAVMTDSGEAVAFNLPTAIHAATEKTTIDDDDEIAGADSEASWGLKKWKWSTVWAKVSTLISTATDALNLGTAAQEDVDAFVAANDESVTNARTPTPHKSTHATGGADALTPGDIGALPASSVSAFGASLIDDADAAAARVTLELGTAATPTFARVNLPTFGSVRSANLGILESGAVASAYWDSFALYAVNVLRLSASGDVGLSKLAAGSMALGNGTAGNTSGLLTLSRLIATSSIRPPSFTVAATLALTGMSAGDTVFVTNEVGGACLATYDGSAWKRQSDLATISA
jgi:hypothetical protein